MADVDITVDANLTTMTSVDRTNDRVTITDAGTATLQDVAPETLVPYATSAEVNTGTEAAKAITPAALSASNYAAALTVKGRVEFLNASVPTTVAATQNVLAGASSPAEQFLYWDFINGSATYVDFLCRLVGYRGGGLTLSALVLRTSAGAASNYVFEAAIRRINAASEDLGAAQTYDYNAVTVTVPAGPPNAGIPMAVTITFTDGADMDSVASGEFFYLRFRRNGGTATDTARVLAGISVVET